MKLGGSALFVQTRLDSSRLPLKALFDLGSRPLVSRVLESFKGFRVDQRVLLVDTDSAPVLAYHAREAGFELFSGSKDNVLGRFVAAIHQFKPAFIVRATGDNPLVAMECAQTCLDACIKGDADHCRMDGLAYGGGVEIVRSAALLELAAGKTSPFEEEHVCPGIWQHPEIFRLLVLEAPELYRYPQVQASMDTFVDYQRLDRYFSKATEPSYLDYCKEYRSHG